MQGFRGGAIVILVIAWWTMVAVFVLAVGAVLIKVGQGD
jgi:hypothetical protein